MGKPNTVLGVMWMCLKDSENIQLFMITIGVYVEVSGRSDKWVKSGILPGNGHVNMTNDNVHNILHLATDSEPFIQTFYELT